MPSSSNKRDEVKAETIDEQEARIAKKVEDTEVYHQTKKDINPNRTWSALDEWGSGGRCIRLDKEINRMSDTGKSLSEAFILTSTNPQYDKRLFIDLPVQYMKTTSSEHFLYINCSECQNKKQFVCTTCSPHVLSL